MDIDTGIFTAKEAGVYRFSFTGNFYSPSGSSKWTFFPLEASGMRRTIYGGIGVIKLNIKYTHMSLVNLKFDDQ